MARTTPHVTDLSDDQRFALVKFRRNIADCKKPEHDDVFLLRWLRARNFNPEAAEKMLRDSLQWRKEWNVDDIDKWEPPEVMKEFYPCGISGYDKDGSPVVVVPFAGLDMWGMLHTIRKSDFVRMTIKTLEGFLHAADESRRKCGVQASKLTVIIDMENFNLRQYAWRPAGEVIVVLLKMYEANYPEILKQAFIINAPKVFSIAFSVVKNFLNEYTISKIQIIKNDPRRWQPLLLDVIPADQLPAYYGGVMTDPDGNPKCPSKICQGGKIPKSLYFMKTETSSKKDNFTKAVVKKGESLKLSYISAQDGSLLRWVFRSEDHDIKFGIITTDMEGKETAVVPVRRVSSQEKEEVGVLTCQAPATYTVVFDNTYSIMRNKTIHYSIIMAPPLEGQLGEEDGEQKAHDS